MEDSGIEIYCDTCKAMKYLPFDLSFSDQTIRCDKCGAAIYWKSCPTCETGYCSNDPDKPCPECK
jgi:hypothetical protein